MKKVSVKGVKLTKKISVPTGHFHSEWFQCTSCGYEVQMLVLGDRATCSQCGGTMRRK